MSFYLGVPGYQLIPFRDYLLGYLSFVIGESVCVRTLVLQWWYIFVGQPISYHYFGYPPQAFQLLQKISFLTNKSSWFLPILFIMIIFTNEHNWPFATRHSHATHHVFNSVKNTSRSKEETDNSQQTRQSRLLLVWNKGSSFKFCHFFRNSKIYFCGFLTCCDGSL